jgi:hypothetical protein
LKCYGDQQSISIQKKDGVQIAREYYINHDSANKSKAPQNESEPIEPIEPHELASQMTSDQLGELIKQLMASKRPPSPKTP